MKIWNFIIAMCFALIPLIIWREYAQNPNAYAITQLCYVTLAFWFVAPALTLLKKTHMGEKKTFFVWNGVNALIAYVVTLAIWYAIFRLNG